MPELPEVHTVATQLASVVVGRRIVDVDDVHSGALSSRSVPLSTLRGQRICSVTRRGKAILIGLDGNATLLVHLRMTGQLVWAAPGHLVESRHLRVRFELDDGAQLSFSDQRRFGYVVLLSPDELRDDRFLGALGPDAMEYPLDAAGLARRLAGRTGTLKAALLDQHVIAGIGNIYADEICWTARVHPARSVLELSEGDLEALAVAIPSVLGRGIELGGATARDYVDGFGERGRFLETAAVYRREGAPCPRCGAAVSKSRVAGRGTHLCAACQPAP
jgi:formamidopyrimidine-DNA glycosylase